jgi:hypothetical protein
MGLTTRVIGLDSFSRQLTSELPGSLLDALGVSLKRELDAVMEESKALCPVGDSEDLRDSGLVSEPIFGAGQVVIQLSYGGDNGEVRYALIQHERLDYAHEAGKQAKFLEQPLAAWTRGGPERALLSIRIGGRA